jgi:uncharacterized protein YggU (UPF0235/DUF167 family)
MYIKVHVYPGMKREQVKKLGNDSYEFLLKEPASRNLANQRAKEMTAKLYNVEAKQVRQLTGHRSQSKIFTLPDSKGDLC